MCKPIPKPFIHFLYVLTVKMFGVNRYCHEIVPLVLECQIINFINCTFHIIRSLLFTFLIMFILLIFRFLVLRSLKLVNKLFAIFIAYIRCFFRFFGFAKFYKFLLFLLIYKYTPIAVS